MGGREAGLVPWKAESQWARSSAGGREARTEESTDRLRRLMTSFPALTVLTKSRAFNLGARSSRVAMKNNPQKTIRSSEREREGVDQRQRNRAHGRGWGQDKFPRPVYTYSSEEEGCRESAGGSQQHEQGRRHRLFRTWSNTTILLYRSLLLKPSPTFPQSRNTM